jgi:hypothetical protein
MRNLIPLLFLAACAANPVPPAPAPVLRDTCTATPYRGLVGQDATALEKVLILRQVRIIRPGTMVTQDMRPERINFQIGPDNRITDITCG